MPRLLPLLLALAACAHAADPAAAPAPARQWPQEPAPALARLSGVFPDPSAPLQTPPLWRRILDAVVGIDPEKQRPALVRPFGLLAEPGGFVVADPDAARVLRVRLSPLTALELSCPDLEWQMPMALAADPQGTLLVADAAAGWVVALAEDGSCRKLGEGELERPSGVAFLDGQIFVVDPPAHAVLAFDRQGALQRRIGSRGDEGNELNFPTAVAAVKGSLLVVDALHFRVARFSPAGEFLGAFGEEGDGGGAFGRPKALAADERGRLFISDAAHQLVLAFAGDGRFLSPIGEPGNGPGQFDLPAGMAAGEGRLYVADSYNHRIQIFELSGDEP